MNYALIDQEIVESLKEIAGDDPSFLPELQSLYVKQYKEKSPEIDKLAKAGELGKIAALVHMIKSSSGNMGAMNFHDLCASLEQNALEGNSNAVAAQIPIFQKAFAQVTAEIQKIGGTKKAA